MKRRTFLSLSAAATLAPRVALGADQIVVDSQQGRLAGRRVDGVSVFKGIRYGEDTQPRRFREALMVKAWQGIRYCEAYGPSCPQDRMSSLMSEDCLFLNIWTPEASARQQRPVLVYLHGGEYSHGSGSSPRYDGHRLCQHDVVAVTLNHRLNAFGHLYLGRQEGAAYATSGNVGILDIVLALRWIQQNISEFGGDPNNVTVFGQSGGGAKIATMMAMPVAAGLFHKAWTMSGQQVTAAGERAADRRARDFRQSLGVGDSLEDLLRLDAERITERLSDRDYFLNRNIYFGPVVDAHALSRHPFYPDAPSQSAHIPMVIGNTREETRAFLGRIPGVETLTFDTLAAALDSQMYVDINTEETIRFYRQRHPDYSATDIFFAASTAGRSWRGAVIEAEVRAQQGAPTYVYQLDWHRPDQRGAGHGSDIPLAFGNLDTDGLTATAQAEQQAVSMAYQSSLIAFARSGRPGGAGLGDWPSYSLTGRETMVIDRQATIVQDPRGDERQYFDRVPFIQRGTF